MAAHPREHWINHWETIGSDISGRDEYIEAEIRRIRHSLELDESIEMLATQLVDQADEIGFTHGRSIDELPPAVVYIACRQQKVGRSLDEISEVSLAHQNGISRTAKQLSSSLGITLDIESPSAYTERIVEKWNRERSGRDLDLLDDSVVERADEIIERGIESGATSGKGRTGIAGAAVKIAAEQMGYDGVTQVAAARVAGVTDLTVRRRIRDLE